MALASGTKLGPYEIQSPLGAGGMGEVYRARDTRLGRDIAIKVLPAAFSQDRKGCGGLSRRRKSLRRLNHPNILAIHDFGEHEGSPYIVTLKFLPTKCRATRVTKTLAGLMSRWIIPWLCAASNPSAISIALPGQGRDQNQKQRAKCPLHTIKTKRRKFFCFLFAVSDNMAGRGMGSL
jgi:hypothetical protein